jgi:hypothetical protein
MIWIVGIGFFLGGAAVGALLFKLLLSDEARIRDLEEQLHDLGEEHENYKNTVHSHFNNSAQLLNKLTDSYREVYLHMADGARSLCPDYISSQLSLSTDARALLDKDRSGGTYSSTLSAPPLDYAARTAPDRKGLLAEDYGFEKLPE